MIRSACLNIWRVLVIALLGYTIDGRFALATQQSTDEAVKEAKTTTGAGEQKDADDKTLEERVKKLQIQLDADEKADRDLAEKELLALGVDVLKFLKPASGEAGLRVDRVRGELEKLSVAGLSEPTFVTLDGEYSMAEIFGVMQKQTGNSLTAPSGNSQKFKVAWSKAPFWTAFDDVLDQSKMAVDIYGGTDYSIALMPRIDGSATRAENATYVGPLRFEPIRVFLSRDFRDPTTNNARVAVEIMWEPRLKPISIALPVNKIVVTNDSGNAVAVNYESETIGASPQEGVSGTELGIPFAIPSRDCKAISSISGTVDVVLPGRLEAFTFADLNSPKEQKIDRAGVTVTFEGLGKNVDVYEAKILVKFADAGGAMESFQSWIYSNQATLIDAAGNRTKHFRYRVYEQTEDSVGVGFMFDVAEKPDNHTLEFETPIGIVRRSFEFKLPKIDLP